jgi:protocatechuate 3,4-dioxygenase beta subunit
LTKQKNKQKQIMLGVLTASMVVSPLASFAESANQTEDTKGKAKVSHVVPLVGNAHGKAVAPNASFQLKVDQDAKEFKSIRQQLEKQSFGVLIVSETGEQIFLSAEKGEVSFLEDGTISIDNHADFSRHTSYSATVLVKSDYQQALKGNLPNLTHTDGFSFQVGSAIGEATKVVANVVDNSVRVTEDAILHVEVTDDYGNPATDATLTVKGQGTGNDKVASNFTAEGTTLITNGTADVILSEDSANLVDVDYTVTDNKTGATVQEGSADIEFSPGQTAQIEVDVPSKIEAGKDYAVTGEAEDVFGNNVEDGTEFDVNTEIGTVSNEAPTVDGEFSFDYTAPTQVGKGDISIVGDDFEYVMEDGIVVVPTAPAKVVVTIPGSVTVGQNTTISGDVVDQYGNPIANEPVTVGGALTGKFTTDKNGHFSGTVTPGSTGAVSATIGGQVVPITNPSGTPITSVTVTPVTPSKVTMTKPSYITGGQNISVSGTLLDQNGNPIANKTVTFTGALSGTLTTNANGSYSGTLKANTSGTVSANVGGISVPVTTPTGSALGTVTVTPPAPVVGTTPKTVSIQAFGYSSITISGKVTDANGLAVPNAKVTLLKSTYGDYWSYGTLQTGYTDANGNYSFSVRGSGITVFVKTDNGSKSKIIPLVWGQWT